MLSPCLRASVVNRPARPPVVKDPKYKAPIGLWVRGGCPHSVARLISQKRPGISVRMVTHHCGPEHTGFGPSIPNHAVAPPFPRFFAGGWALAASTTLRFRLSPSIAVASRGLAVGDRSGRVAEIECTVAAQRREHLGWADIPTRPSSRTGRGKDGAT